MTYSAMCALPTSLTLTLSQREKGKLMAALLLISMAATLPAQNWSTIADIVPQAIGESVSYTSTNSSVLPNKLTAVLFLNYNGLVMPAGGFDLENGVITKAYFNDLGNSQTPGRYGLVQGDTANTPRGRGGDADNTTIQGYWEIYYDFDGNGNFNGKYLGYGSIGSRVEIINSNDYEITNFTPYGDSDSGYFTFTYYGSEIETAPNLTGIILTSLCLSHAGTESFALIADLTAAFRNSDLGLEADYNHLAELLYKPSLSTPEWTLLPTPFALTNTTTRITFTNTAPQGFARCGIRGRVGVVCEQLIKQLFGKL